MNTDSQKETKETKIVNWGIRTKSGLVPVRMRARAKAPTAMPEFPAACGECGNYFGHESDCSQWRLSPRLKQKQEFLAAKERRERTEENHRDATSAEKRQ